MIVRVDRLVNLLLKINVAGFFEKRLKRSLEKRVTLAAILGATDIILNDKELDFLVKNWRS